MQLNLSVGFRNKEFTLSSDPLPLKKNIVVIKERAFTDLGENCTKSQTSVTYQDRQQQDFSLGMTCLYLNYDFFNCT